MIVFDAKKFLGPGSFLGIDWPYLLAEWYSNMQCQKSL